MEKILEVLGSIGFDWRVALANFANFLIVFYLLNRFVFSKIRKTLGERKAAIEKGFDDAKKAEAALLMAEEQERAIVQRAALKANEIVAKANHRGNQLIKTAEEKGRKEGDGLIRKAQVDIEKKKREAEKQIEENAAQLVVSGMHKLLIKEVQGAKNEEFIGRMLKKAKTLV